MLPSGTFTNYKTHMTKEGADLAELRPPRINPDDSVLDLLGIRQSDSLTQASLN